jgi:spermidine synthase
VELNPAVIVSARSMFFTPDDDRRLETLQTDAKAFVKSELVTRTSLMPCKLICTMLFAMGQLLVRLNFTRAASILLKTPGVIRQVKSVFTS